MENSIENHKLENDQELAARGLLAGEISPDEFFNKLFELDQSSSDRKGAIENVAVLEKPEVRAFFESGDSKAEYDSALSFAYFHVGQIKALEEGDDLVVLDYFKKSLAFDGLDNEWANYVRGTIAYLEGDTQVLTDCLEKESLNKQVLERLLVGLKERGRPDYKSDY